MQEGPEFDSIVRPGDVSVEFGWVLSGYSSFLGWYFFNYILSQSTDAIITVTTTAVVS